MQLPPPPVVALEEFTYGGGRRPGAVVEIVRMVTPLTIEEQASYQLYVNISAAYIATVIL